MPTCPTRRQPIPHAPSPQPTNFVMTAMEVTRTANKTTAESPNISRLSCIPILTMKNGTKNSVTPDIRLCISGLSSATSAKAIRQKRSDNCRHTHICSGHRDTQTQNERAHEQGSATSLILDPRRHPLHHRCSNQHHKSSEANRQQSGYHY